MATTHSLLVAMVFPSSGLARLGFFKIRNNSPITWKGAVPKTRLRFST